MKFGVSIVTEVVTVLPAATVTAAGDTARLKSIGATLPVSAAVCGLLASLSATLKVAVGAPLVVGVKTTSNEQLAPGARVESQFSNGFPRVGGSGPVIVNAAAEGPAMEIAMPLSATGV
jgi:streptogramin lyase